jgi:hypothetical protein
MYSISWISFYILILQSFGFTLKWKFSENMWGKGKGNDKGSQGFESIFEK